MSPDDVYIPVSIGRLFGLARWNVLAAVLPAGRHAMPLALLACRHWNTDSAVPY